MARNGKAPAESREGERRRTILRAAIEVFAKKGYHGCRIADVAKEAGVAYGLVYHYFQNKEQLLRSVFESGWGGFVDRVREVAGGPGSLEEKVNAIVGVAFAAYKKDPRTVRVLILEIARSPAGAKVNRDNAFSEVMRLAEEMFAQGKRDGQLRQDADPLLCATLLFGAIEMGLTAFVVGFFDRRDEEALVRARQQVADFFLHGVLPRNNAETSWKSEGSGTKLRPVRQR